MFREDFAIFILSHGRANNVKTVKTLEREGYTGKWYIICDNESALKKTLCKNCDKFIRRKIK